MLHTDVTRQMVRDSRHVYVMGTVRGGFSESGHTETSGAPELDEALSRLTTPDEIYFPGLSTAYHLDLRLHQPVKPSIASVAFLNLSLPSKDIPGEMALVRRYLPTTIFVLYTDGDELTKFGRDAPAALSSRLGHFYVLPKGRGEKFDTQLRRILDDAKAAALQRRDETRYYSCFISYSHKDEALATKLCEALQGRGIHCWLDKKDVLPGDKIHSSVDQAIRQWDKLLLCASRNSLTSWWVENEIGSAIAKEQGLWKERGREVLVLIPIDLDGYLFSEEWQSGWRNQLRARLAANFQKWDKDYYFDQAFEELAKALRANGAAASQAPESKL